VGEWFKYGDLKKDTQFYHQLQETEKHNQTLPDKIKYPTYHSPETWHSRLINTKRITELYQASKDLELTLDSLNIQEEPEQTSHIEIPPK